MIWLSVKLLIDRTYVIIDSQSSLIIGYIRLRTKLSAKTKLLRMRKNPRYKRTLRISRVGMPRIHARGERIRLACKLCSWKREAPTSNEVKWWVIHINETSIDFD